MKVALIGTVVSSTLIFRIDLIRCLVAAKHQVFVFCVDFDDDSRKKISLLGAIPIDYKLSRAGINPLSDIISVISLRRLFKKIQPDVVFSYFVKPVIYGSIAAYLAKVPKCIAMLEGLGYVFTDRPAGIDLKQNILRKIQLLLYRFALNYIDNLIFLNPDDPIDLLEKNGLIAKRVSVLGGIGLDLSAYPYSSVSVEPVRFIFIARLLAEKGIFEYLEAAQKTKKRYPESEFFVLGGLDEENPGGLKYKQLKALQDAEVIIYPGYVDNVAQWITDSSVFVLPSYYREGVPRSTQEAMAIGRAVLTTDVPGCRETVVDGVNGFLIPKWNAQVLAEKMQYLIKNPKEIRRMGIESHKMAVEKFDSTKVNKKLINFIFD